MLKRRRIAEELPAGYLPNGTATPPLSIGWEAPAGNMYSTTKYAWLILSVCLSLISTSLFLALLLCSSTYVCAL